MERTVWDGDQVLFEIRAPLEPGQFAVSNPESETGGGGFPHEYYGRVAYVHAGGIDQPLEIVRMDVGQPFSGIPHANWRGTYDVVTFTGSRYAECGPQIGYALGTVPECYPFELASVNAFGEVKPRGPGNTDPGPRSWTGSLITGSRDASGMLYRRNRYLNAKTGRFTQEDPIGLAGGLNAYGFASGDPLTFSDPFGLKVYFNGKRGARTMTQILDNAMKLAGGVSNATNMRIVLTRQESGELCVKSATAASRDSRYAGLQRRFNNMVNSRRAYVVATSQGASEYDLETRTAYIGSDVCLPINMCGGNVARSTLESVIVHELFGHGTQSAFASTRLGRLFGANERHATAVENEYHAIVSGGSRCRGAGAEDR